MGNKNKTALVTGSASGLGFELALLLARDNYDLILIDIDADNLEQAKTNILKKYNSTIRVLVKDLSQLNIAQEIYNEVRDTSIDVIINNAGFGALGKFHELVLERQISMINLNVTALTALTHLFLPDFVKRNNGKILNTSSTASFMPGPLQAVYFATKAYVTFFSNALAEELYNTNITVTNLMPGATESEFGATS